MTKLHSLETSANVAVIGASGGLGQAFCKLLAADAGVASIHAFSRSAISFESAKLSVHSIDIGDEAAIEAAAEAVKHVKFDLVLVLTGILHEGESLQPERRLSDLAWEKLERVLAINTIGPAIVAKHFLPLLRWESKAVFSALSARVGSISDNRLGGWVSYRASKAALNQVLRTLAIEQARISKNIVIAALHPGTVDTGLSQPFTSRTPPEKLFTPEQSAAYLLKVIDDLSPEDSGGFFAWDGQAIEY